MAVRPTLRGLKIGDDPNDLPARLSETGLFRSLAELTPGSGLVPYDVNSPLWSDGARKRRWIALPGGERIGFRPEGEWTFPAGTVLVKHFDLPVDEKDTKAVRRLETRMLYADGRGGGYGATYRWRSDGSEADLVPAEGATEVIHVQTESGERSQSWTYPAREDCLKCHTEAAGFVLGPKTRQINREFHYGEGGPTDNQLRTWNSLGMFQPTIVEAQIPRFERLVPIDDTSASLDLRVRSYLDANCANCHRPGANIPAAFDARFGTLEKDRGIIDAQTRSDSLGINEPRVVAPGDLGRSMLYQRMIVAERFVMPPLARSRVDEAAVAAIAEWIKGMEASAPTSAKE